MIVSMRTANLKCLLTYLTVEQPFLSLWVWFVRSQIECTRILVQNSAHIKNFKPLLHKHRELSLQGVRRSDFKTLMQGWLLFFWKPCQSHIRKLLRACIHVWRGYLTWSLYKSTTLSNHPVRPAVWQTVYTQLAVRLNMLSVYLWETATAALRESCLWNTALDAKTMGVNVAGDTTAEPLELLQKSQLS